MTRVIGVDHGSSRIGLAVGDTETGMAFARPAIRGRGVTDAVETVLELARHEGAELAVIGLPLHMDGSEGTQAGHAREFGAALDAAGLDVAFEDERLSSWEAAEQLGSARRRPSRASGELDSAAARVILQQYLDARRPPRGPEETE